MWQCALVFPFWSHFSCHKIISSRWCLCCLNRLLCRFQVFQIIWMNINFVEISTTHVFFHRMRNHENTCVRRNEPVHFSLFICCVVLSSMPFLHDIVEYFGCFCWFFFCSFHAVVKEDYSLSDVKKHKFHVNFSRKKTGCKKMSRFFPVHNGSAYVMCQARNTYAHKKKPKQNKHILWGILWHNNVCFICNSFKSNFSHRWIEYANVKSI